MWVINLTLITRDKMLSRCAVFYWELWILSKIYYDITHYHQKHFTQRMYYSDRRPFVRVWSQRWNDFQIFFPQTFTSVHNISVKREYCIINSCYCGTRQFLSDETRHLFTKDHEPTRLRIRVLRISVSYIIPNDIMLEYVVSVLFAWFSYKDVSTVVI